MRLLIAESIEWPRLQFIDFNPDEIEPYAILSHTWGKNEVLFTDVVNGTAADRAAFPKVRYACGQALHDGLKYVWVDTCCIDKSSSAELSEAINSMFMWYRQAAVCYAYLSDLFGEGGFETLAESRWFTRGWTLQELIAPANVVFYAAGWVNIGDKVSLKAELASITGINEDILVGKQPLETASVANRMGWAARRRTTRPEDMAYCLMGIFSVNMPLLYGEGAKAFIRLQEEIMKQSTDHSLFVWMDERAPDDKECGFLAPSPKCFDKTRAVVPYHQWEAQPPHAMTGKGLSIHLPMLQVRDDTGALLLDNANRVIWYAILDCPSFDFNPSYLACVYMVQTQALQQDFARIRSSEVASLKIDAVGRDKVVPRKQVYISPSLRTTFLEPDMEHHICIRTIPESKIYKAVQIKKFGALGGGLSDSHAILVSEHWDIMMRNMAAGHESERIPVVRDSGKLSLAIMFERQSDGKRLFVSVGSFDGVRLAFGAQEAPEEEPPPNAPRSRRKKPELARLPTPQVMEQLFVPSAMGRTLALQNHTVTVVAESYVSAFVKYTLLDIHIQSLANYPSMVIRNGETEPKDKEPSQLRRLLGRTF